VIILEGRMELLSCLGEAVLWVACPHHYYEIHVKKVARLYFGDTSNPRGDHIKETEGQLE
jgi:hypothetical protein